MAYKNGIYEIAQDVKLNLAEGPVATGEMDLCFPQCTATETALILCAITLRSNFAQGAMGEPPMALGVGGRDTKYAGNPYSWTARSTYSFLDLSIFCLQFTEFPMCSLPQHSVF